MVAEVPSVVALTERWKRVAGPTPDAWAGPELFEVVPPSPNVRLLGQ